MESLVPTRMHSSRMRTARSLTVSPYLVVSHACPPGATTHTPPRATTHAPPGATTHAPPVQPCTPPGATTHAPQSNHACPPGATMLAAPPPHPWEQPRTPPPLLTESQTGVKT